MIDQLIIKQSVILLRDDFLCGRQEDLESLPLLLGENIRVGQHLGGVQRPTEYIVHEGTVGTQLVISGLRCNDNRCTS